MPQLQLPVYYYHDHFLEMLDFVNEVCAECLTAEANVFISRFRQLSLPERCLYIRMANRKGYIFDIRQLVYDEIEDIGAARYGLMQKGFVQELTDQDAHGFLETLTKNDLIALCREADLIDVKSSWAKAKIIAHAITHFTTASLSDYWPLNHYVVRAEVEMLDYLIFLYFGRYQESLKAFTLRDLGIVKANGKSTFQSRFADIQEATCCFACKRIEILLDRGQLDEAMRCLSKLKVAPTDYAANCHSRITHKLGLAFERLKNIEQAIAVLRLATGSDCRERLIRLLHTRGEKDEAKSLLEQAIDDPYSDSEYNFATDFYRRKFQGERIGALTSLLRQGSSMYLDDAHRDCPEYGVIANYKQEGWQAFFTENQLWHELFGLIFWDELFGTDSVSGNGFDHLPFSIVKGTFWKEHQHSITSKLEKIKAGKALNLALHTISKAWAQPNGLFSWEYLDIEIVTAFLNTVSYQAIGTILQAMARNFISYRDGFPDLMLIKEGMLKFVEVKAEGDVIRRNQLSRMQQLRSAGIDTEICRVQYRYDPQQTYVVVDIETTGQSADHGKITEIGAVKMHGNKIIGEWHSLINPERRIPAFITELTGITDSMISDAPKFAEIAEDFASFVEGAIFAAHNVSFDYSFIRAEYARLNMKFKLPKFCTCAGMRRYFPGQKSYSLGNLCVNYGINLTEHHRALADARAASQLLSMITDLRDTAAA